MPYRNTSRPSISVWEYRAAVRQVRKQGTEKLDEDAIFAAYDRMRALELAAVEKTQRMTKSTRRMLRGMPAEEMAIHFQTGPLPEPTPVAVPDEPRQPAEPTEVLPVINLQPFEGSAFYNS